MDEFERMAKVAPTARTIAKTLKMTLNFFMMVKL
jgi:hypothetical protein